MMKMHMIGRFAVGAMVAIGFAIVCMVCVFAAPTHVDFDGVSIPGHLSKSGLENWAADHPAAAICRFGFRTVMLANAIISSAFLAVCATFTQATPAALMFGLLLIGGFFRSLQFTSINTLAYADIEPARVSRATSLVSVMQQLAISAGVAFGALAVELTVQFRGEGTLGAHDFPPAFIAVAIVSAISTLFFVRLSPHAGAEMSNRTHLRDKADEKSAT